MMKRKFLIVSFCLILIATLFFFFEKTTNSVDSELLSNLEGEIYYTKRVDQILTLFKSDGSLKNEQMIYSHKGQGEDGYGSNNDNIIDYYVDRENANISLIAMNKGNWSLFTISEGKDSATLIEKADFLPKTDYIKPSTDKLNVEERKGSIYLIENGKEECIKKFNGIYDSKFTGYSPIGFSPDGNYLVYHSMDHLTPFGTIVEGIINDSYGHTYIMDIKTRKSSRFIDASNIQWIEK
jgi:hypothetical protein